jgi:hypothetical protein
VQADLALETGPITLPDHTQLTKESP